VSHSEEFCGWAMAAGLVAGVVSVLYCVVVCRSVLQCVAVYCSNGIGQVTVRGSVLHYVAMCCSVL